MIHGVTNKVGANFIFRCSVYFTYQQSEYNADGRDPADGRVIWDSDNGVKGYAGGEHGDTLI